MFPSVSGDLLIYIEGTVIEEDEEDDDDIYLTGKINRNGHWAGNEWIPSCVYRADCYDCCMYRKSHHLFNYGNWIEIANFIRDPVSATAVWMASCGWDCLTSDY